MSWAFILEDKNMPMDHGQVHAGCSSLITCVSYRIHKTSRNEFGHFVTYEKWKVFRSL